MAAVAAIGCTSFEDPNLVIDLRVLAMTASPPEQVIDVDLSNPPSPSELLQQIVPAEVCALVADPGESRRLRYQLTLCMNGDFARCHPELQVVIGRGTVDDPDTALPAPRMCATVNPDGNLLGIALETLEGDALRGLGGIEYMVELQVGGEDADPALDLYASKRLQISPRIPAARTANTNPTLTRIDASIDMGDPIALGTGRCVDQPAPYQIAPGTEVRLTPIEPDGVREVYLVPTLDGTSQTFTESLTYQWLAGAGNVSSGTTGGTRDAFGNVPDLFTEWTAPDAEDLEGPTDIALWVVQRDERLGARWFEACIRVVPN